MLYGWGAVGVVYHLSARLQGPGTLLPDGWIDRLIPFSPTGIWLYLSFFLIVPLAYLSCPPARLNWLRRSMQLTALAAGGVYLLWPTTLHYPPVNGDSLSARLLLRLTAIDSPQNCLPSLHMALTTLAVWALFERRRPLRSGVYLCWAIAIAFSILQLRRHLFIDLLTGGILAAIIGLFCLRLTERSPRRSPGVER
ncbi:inositol phosphorylceramide synthase [Affinibrenneria salicis]|uniref:Inositol phosphorylceramide synthase n=2 Tax=Affinibrenneria salicis TaxID=2590031 RepID=A0A5J5G0Z2_9GAMM|nr:inositol phosphorylceramide synthase [Affinibrenneria salicis]